MIQHLYNKLLLYRLELDRNFILGEFFLEKIPGGIETLRFFEPLFVLK